MDKNFLKNYNLTEAQKRFQQICEYTFMSSPLLNEKGEDDEQNDDSPQDNMNSPMGNNMNEPQGDNQQPPMNGPQGDDMNMPMNGQQGDNQQPPMNEPQGDDMNMPMDGPQGDNQQPPMNGPQGDDMNMPMDGPQGDDMDFGNALGEEDEVIDVDDLTKAQEESEEKIEGVDDKLSSLLGVVKKFIKALDQNDKKLEDLKKEFERRNPTEEEKLNLRSLASYPFNVNPKDYWKEKTANSNYTITFDNETSNADEGKEKEYIFHKKDLNSMNDKSIADSFSNYNKPSDFVKF